MVQQPKLGVNIQHHGVQRQEQRLQLTPQLAESIELLQLPSVDVLAIIQRELEQNPFLTTQEMEDEKAAEQSDDSSDLLNLETEEYPDGEDLWESQDLDIDDANAGFSYAALHTQSQSGDSRLGFEETTADTPSLKQFIEHQLMSELRTTQQRIIGLHLIDSLDHDGYLREDLANLSKQLGCKESSIAAVLKRIHTCEPTGVGARNLAECISLQLEDKNQLTNKARLVLKHLDLLAKCQLDLLAKRCQITQAELALIISHIRACDPKPGRAFYSEASTIIVPDVIIRKGKLGQWLIELNSEILPQILINQQYRTSLDAHHERAGMKQYVATQFNHAQFLVRALHQRAQSILKVATEIVFAQELFLTHGINYLKPMKLADIAGAIGVHESTVSRIVNQKYMATPRGTYEMRFFFSSGVSQEQGTDISSHAVKEKIKELIDKESVGAILSDEDVVSLLRGQGISMSRRTVTKYREALGIPSSPQRRREKTLVKT